MFRAARGRRIVMAAAYGSGGVGALGVATWGLIKGESLLTRRRIPQAEADPPRASGLWRAKGVSRKAPEIVIAMLGDSTAAGYGVHDELDTPGVRIALAISAMSRRPVRLLNVAAVGARSEDLLDQVRRVLQPRPSVAIIMIGANDVTHRVKAAASVRHLNNALALLSENNVEFVVGTCPDLGTIRPMPQPLRSIARRLSRNLATAQAIAVVGAGGRAVSLGNLLAPEFEAHHTHMFAADRFHPSVLGYQRAADVLIPSAADALGLMTVSRHVGPFTTSRARPIAKAAARAVNRPGTEVSGAEKRGQTAGPRGPWARLVRRGGAPRAVTSETPDGPDEGQPATIAGKNPPSEEGLAHG